MIKLLYKPAGMLVSVRRAGQSGGGYARLFPFAWWASSPCA